MSNVIAINKLLFRTMLIAAIVVYLKPRAFAQKSLTPTNIRISWQIIENSYQKQPKFLAALTFTNKNTEALPATGWKIFFNLRYHGANLSPVNSPLSITHVNGELFYISPSQAFKGLPANDSITMQFTGTGRIANYNDMPGGMFWVNDKDNNKAYALNGITVIQSAAQPMLDAIAIFNKNRNIEDIPENRLPKVFPTPVQYHETAGSFILDATVPVNTEGLFVNEAHYLSEQLQKLLGKSIPVNTHGNNKTIQLSLKAGMGDEEYDLLVTGDNVQINASTSAGAFYGIQSLLSLLPADAWQNKRRSFSIPCVAVNDAPSFAYRAFMLDVSRHFQSKKEILRILDLMALYKLNVFHLHFCDDEGWRIEIPGLPELTTVGAQRGYPFKDKQRLQPSYGSGPDAQHSNGSGYYSVQDFVDILKYATTRHIKVIPEIESPGHARAAIVGMDARYAKYMVKGDTAAAMKYMLHDIHDTSKYISAQLFNDNVMNAALTSTYRFVEKVFDELQAMYKTAGAPLTMMHMGGDEVPEGVWAGSPAVQAFMQSNPSVKDAGDLWKTFFIKISALLKSKGLSLYGWEELVTGKPDERDIRTVNANTAFAKDGLQVDAWANVIGGGNEAIPYQLANAGYKVVLSSFDYFYFDLAYTRSFNEPGDGWIGFLDIDKLYGFIPYNYYKNAHEDIAGKPLPPNLLAGKEQLTAAGKNNIVGLQGAMWEENIGTPALLEYLLVPRILALAERAWAKQPAWAETADTAQMRSLFQHDFSVFANVLSKRELSKLSFYNNGYNYRIPPPGIALINGNVAANIQLPGFTLRYTTDGGLPTTTSSVYSAPIATKGLIRIAAFDAAGRSSAVVAVDNK